MNTVQYAEFMSRVGLLSHDKLVIEQGGECCTYLTLPTIREGRRVLSMATQANRQARQKTFFNPPIAARRRLGQGMHDRGEAVSFAAGTIDHADLDGQSRHLPIHVKAVSVLRRTIAAGDVWDVSVRGEAWGLDDMEELYVTVNVGTLVIEPGASLIVRGNVFSLLCQEIIYPGEPPEDAFQIGILPTPFSVDFGNGPLHGAHGVDGAAGRSGTDGRKLEAERTLLGWRLRDQKDLSVMMGDAGEAGKDGTDGARGRNGGMCKLAELTLRSVSGSITVFAQAGAGGAGGHGGHGGNGGGGGKGGDGYKLWQRIINGGDGGDGGRGGGGAKGGHGGNGGLASNIYVAVPVEDEYKITRIAHSSQGGNPGEGGRGGAGGEGGRGGAGPEAQFDGKPGRSGAQGATGLAGRCGKSRPAPWIFLNDNVKDGHFLARGLESSTTVSTSFHLNDS